jgi:hypothetical protein
MSEAPVAETSSDGVVEDATVSLYQTTLAEAYRPPSKGGNTRAWHTHTLTIEDERYSFLALGSKKWVFAGDFVSFKWAWNETRRYRNIIPETISTKDKHGEVVVRGDRGNKPWRTALTRLPARRREWK